MSEQATETGAPAPGNGTGGSQDGSQPPEGTGTPPEGTGTPPEGTEGGNGQESANSEAARYRTQLRAAEAERDTLTTRVEALQRRAVEGMAAEKLAQPGDVLAFGAELTDLLDESGDVDAAKVTAAVEKVLTERPGLAKFRWPDTGGGYRGEPVGRGSSWGDVLGKGARK